MSNVNCQGGQRVYRISQKRQKLLILLQGPVKAIKSFARTISQDTMESAMKK